MIIDTTGTILTPGNGGADCLGNGMHYDENGVVIECCCDECDYYLCCSEDIPMRCDRCHDPRCPHCPDPYKLVETRSFVMYPNDRMI